MKKDKDNGSADVNMSFGGFQLRVKAVSYRTGDSPEKVEAFYRAGLKRFGDVIACRDNRAVGSPARTQEGLTCDNNMGTTTRGRQAGEGRAGAEGGIDQHQHIVEIDAEGGGTKIGLVALDLPGDASSVTTGTTPAVGDRACTQPRRLADSGWWLG